MIDLHSHLLPGVDDGSRSVEQSLDVLGEMARRGVTDVCLTPHVRASDLREAPAEAHDEAFTSLSARAPAVPRLHRGSEVMLDRPLPADPLSIRRFTLGGTRYILVEFPRMVAFGAVTNALTRVHESGLVAVLAHPERYSCCRPETVEQWRGLGAKMQLDAATLLMASARGVRARALLERGLGDIIAGDNHGDYRSVADGFQFVIDQEGPEQAELLARGNPGAILRDEPLSDVPPLRIKLSFMQRLKVLLEGEE